MTRNSTPRSLLYVALALATWGCSAPAGPGAPTDGGASADITPPDDRDDATAVALDTNVVTTDAAVSLDAVSPDAVPPDAVPPDAVSPDAVSPDAVSVDAVSVDAVSVDTVSVDTVSVDTVSVDTVSVDTVSVDTVSDRSLTEDDRGRVDAPGDTDADVLGARLDAPEVPRDVAADATAGSDGGAPVAWELVGEFANGLWQWGADLAVAPDGTIYLGRANTGVYRGVPRGTGYVFDLMPNAGLTNLRISAIGVNDLGEPLVGTAGPMYGATGPGTLFRYRRDAGTWIAATVPSPGYTRNVTDFYLAPDGSVLVAGGWAALVLRSTDHGSTYAIRANLDAIRPNTYYGLLFSIEVGPGNEMIVGAETEGFQHSFDDGAHFTPLDTAVWLQRGNPYGVGFTSAGEGLFSRAIDADPTKIYRRDRVRGWVRADLGLERDPINAAPANGWIDTIVLAPWGENLVSTLNGIYRARDGGPWTPFMSGIDLATWGPYPNVIARHGRCVYAGVRPVAPRSDAGAIYRACAP